MEIKILYEDKGILICEKPVGEVSQSSGDGDEVSFPARLRAYRRDKGEDSYIGVVHRLDTSTGGVIMYSKDEALTGKLSELVSQKEYEKTYLAVVSGRPDERGEMTDLLFHDKQKNKTYVVKKTRRGVKEARLYYELLRTVTLESGESANLVRIRLFTGRTHQIRVQFASRKMPLLGDGKYGSREKGCVCALWSYQGRFMHPKTGKEVCVTSTPPNDYPWNLFSSQEN